jgi:hypothetical protein
MVIATQCYCNKLAPIVANLWHFATQNESAFFVHTFLIKLKRLVRVNILITCGISDILNL